MTFPIYFYLTLLIISPWPVFFSFLFYNVYRFDTIFEYYISKKKQLYKFWFVLLFLPIIFFSIFSLRYKRIGISLDLLEITENFLSLISPLSYLDLVFLFMFLGLFIVLWILALRIVYQYFRKCLLALYLYFHQYKKIKLFYTKILLFSVDYDLYLWRRVKIFTSNKKVIIVTKYICPIFTDTLERNLYFAIIPYLIVFDFNVQAGVLSKIFLILPWYYVYSLVRFALKLFFQIHKIENWNLSEEMYGYFK